MTIKKNLENEIDDTWRRKGHSHVTDNKYIPHVCPTCNGYGYIKDFDIEYMKYPCTTCGGIGEI